MGSFSFWHWMIVMIVILVVFGAGKLPNVMGDVAKGLKAFRREMANDGKAPAQEKTAAPDIQKET